MKVGDLVRRKYSTYTDIRGWDDLKQDPNAVGIVIEESYGACKVLISSPHKQIRSFLKDSLEVIG